MSGDTSFTHLIPAMKGLTSLGQSTNFTLCMQHNVNQHFDAEYNYKDYSFHPRWNQPCQGGEMRKYSDVHGTENCTEHKSKKPQDLHHPFPDGNPVMVGVNFMYANPGIDDFLKAVLSSDSPYRRGIGKPELIVDKGYVSGVVMTDTKIDPTVMVNLFQFVNHNLSMGRQKDFKRLIDGGASTNEALALIYVTQSLMYLSSTYDYYFSTKFSVRRFMSGKSHDLTGGTFFDRYDYNRIKVQDLFEEKDKSLALISERDFKKVYTSGAKPDDITKGLIEVLREKLAEQLAATEVKVAA